MNHGKKVFIQAVSNWCECYTLKGSKGQYIQRSPNVDSQDCLEEEKKVYKKNNEFFVSLLVGNMNDCLPSKMLSRVIKTHCFR